MIKVICVFCRLHIYNIEEGELLKAENFTSSDVKYVNPPRAGRKMKCPHCKEQFFFRTPRGIKILTDKGKLYPGGQDLDELMKKHGR